MGGAGGEAGRSILESTKQGIFLPVSSFIIFAFANGQAAAGNKRPKVAQVDLASPGVQGPGQAGEVHMLMGHHGWRRQR